MEVFIFYCIVLVLLEIAAELTGKFWLSILAILLVIVPAVGSGVAEGLKAHSVLEGIGEGIIQAVLAGLIGLIPLVLGFSIGEKLKGNGGSSCSTTSSLSSSYTDIPHYYNWDEIYDSLKGQEISENGPMTLERAIEHFRRDYAHIRNAFSNEEKLQGYEVDDYKKDILEMFDRFEKSLATNQVSLSDYGNLRFRISCKKPNGSVQYYDHFPVRQYSKYDMRMWKGYLYIHDEYWVSYGLSNEHRQQYWRAFDGHYRFGMDASHGKAEETAIR